MREVGAMPESEQMERRRAEHDVKCRAIAFSRLVDKCKARGGSCRHDAAGYLSMRRQCLNNWRREWGKRELVPHRRGRPKTDSGRDAHEKALELLEQIGPSLSLATLRSLVPELGRNEAGRILAEFRKACRNELRAEIYALRWKRPGAVWAMDHMESPSPVDGEYPYILMVRDLASRFQLMALPQRSPTDVAVADALEELFIQYGAPLVLKSDNAGCFAGPETTNVLQRWGVQHLFSPPHLPRYNGSIEAGIGQNKTRIHIIAAQHGRPGRWTADDVEGARLLMNRTLRPWGRGGPTPEERWNGRILIDERERERLHHLNESFLAQYRAELPDDFWDRREYQPYFKIVGGSNEEPVWAKGWNRQICEDTERSTTMSGATQNGAGQCYNQRLYWRKLERRSLTDAMVAMELLAIEKRVIPLPIRRIMRIKIT